MAMAQSVEFRFQKLQKQSSVPYRNEGAGFFIAGIKTFKTFAVFPEIVRTPWNFFLLTRLTY